MTNLIEELEKKSIVADEAKFGRVIYLYDALNAISLCREELKKRISLITNSGDYVRWEDIDEVLGDAK